MRRLLIIASVLTATAALTAFGAEAATNGHPPTVRLRSVVQGLSATFRESGRRCDHAAESGAVGLWDQGHKLVIATRDICSGPWVRRGHIPGFSAQITPLPEEGAVVTVLANGDNATAGYRVVARTGRHRATGWLVIDRERFWHYERIYEGTDAFVNFCIDRDRELRSHNGRLYCTRESPVKGPNFVEFHRG